MRVVESGLGSHSDSASDSDSDAGSDVAASDDLDVDALAPEMAPTADDDADAEGDDPADAMGVMTALHSVPGTVYTGITLGRGHGFDQWSMPDEFRYALRGGSLPHIDNVVGTGFVFPPVDVREFAWRARGDFNPEAFFAARIKLWRPRATLFWFFSGRFVLTGCKSPEDMGLAATIFVGLVERLMGQRVRIVGLCVRNCVGGMDFGHAIDLQSLLKEYGIAVNYVAANFPGLWMHGSEIANSSCLLLFCRGPAVGAGYPHPAAFLSEVERTRPVLARFRTDEVEGMPVRDMRGNPKTRGRRPQLRIAAATGANRAADADVFDEATFPILRAAAVRRWIENDLLMRVGDSMERAQARLMVAEKNLAYKVTGK